MTSVRHYLVEDYLRRLDNASTPLSSDRRAELRQEITEHIDAGLEEAEGVYAAAVRNLLKRLGPPGDIVSAELSAARSWSSLPAIRPPAPPATSVDPPEPVAPPEPAAPPAASVDPPEAAALPEAAAPPEAVDAPEPAGPPVPPKPANPPLPAFPPAPAKPPRPSALGPGVADRTRSPAVPPVPAVPPLPTAVVLWVAALVSIVLAVGLFATASDGASGPAEEPAIQEPGPFPTPGGPRLTEQ
ncbi:hypothetical protein [Streptomyces sp. B6B3]|uniref:HAAS signaling domain-containing protein n=1 Tax=Streptomyces sp. B6B3 TaxID=3153570 RepID=UPI00325EA935